MYDRLMYLFLSYLFKNNSDKYILNQQLACNL